MAPGTKRTTSERSIGATIAGEETNPQQIEVNNPNNLQLGANSRDHVPGSSTQHEVVTKGELNKMVDEINQKMANSQKALMEKIDTLLALQSLTTPKLVPEAVAATEQEHSSVSGLNGRNRRQKQKEAMGGAPRIMMEENVNTPPTAKAPATNPNLGVKTPREDITMALSGSEDDKQFEEDKLDENANVQNARRSSKTHVVAHC